MTILLGCIADDFTGATDLGNNLARAGMRVEQTVGLPSGDDIAADLDAVIVSLKSRTAPVAQAVEQSCAAARWLRAQGARQIYFKVCSTFDSTPAGNIGPVTEALMELLGADFVMVNPAFPELGRTVFKGHLFVGDLLLSDSPMRNHPLTPMTDANLRRVLQAQLDPQKARQTGIIDHSVLSQGAAAVLGKVAQLKQAGCSLAIVDAVNNADLFVMAQASRDQPLVVAGSGLAIAIPQTWGLDPQASRFSAPRPSGRQAIVAGSCSVATLAQIKRFADGNGAVLALDPLCADASTAVRDALTWAEHKLESGPVLIYASAAANVVRAVQQQLGVEQAASKVEQMLASIAQGLVARGVDQLVVAGGETSGAVVQALGIRRLRIGPAIAPGVPWCHAPEQNLHIALKSGNFGGDDFFRQAFVTVSAP